MRSLLVPTAIFFLGAVFASSSLFVAAPIWILAVPLLLTLKRPLDLAAALGVGFGVDAVSGHPPGLTTVLLVSATYGSGQVMRHLEDTPILRSVIAFLAAVFVLIGLMLSRLLFLSLKFVPVDVATLVSATFSQRVLLALVAASAAALMLMLLRPQIRFTRRARYT